MKFTLALLVVAAVLGCVLGCSDSDFEKFKSDFKKKYDSAEEEAFRKGVFCPNFDKITAHNKLYDEKKTTYTQGVNAFTDMTQQEMRQMMGWLGGRP